MRAKQTSRPKSKSQSKTDPTRSSPNRIRRYRKAMHLGQKQFAILMGLGSVAALSRYENGLLTPSLKNVILLELILGLPAWMIYPEIGTRLARDIRLRREKLSQLLPHRFAF